jgi:hypothetical protein
VFDPLIDGEDRDVSGPLQPACSEYLLEVSQNGGLAVRGDENPVHKIRPGQMETSLRDAFAGVFEKGFRIGTKELFDFPESH